MKYITCLNLPEQIRHFSLSTIEEVSISIESNRKNIRTSIEINDHNHYYYTQQQAACSLFTSKKAHVSSHRPIRLIVDSGSCPFPLFPLRPGGLY